MINQDHLVNHVDPVKHDLLAFGEKSLHRINMIISINMIFGARLYE